MTKNTKLKKNKKRNKDILFTSLIILSGMLVAFASIILSNSEVDLKKTNSTLVIDKVKNVQAMGGAFELTQKDIDEISNLYFKSHGNNGNIIVKGINVEVLNDEVLIKAPVCYKKLHLLLTSKGKLNFTNGEITYIADNFKIGNLPLPKILVISKILKLPNNVLYTEDNLIKINPTVFPFKINTFKVANNKIVGTIEKLNVKLLLKNTYNKGLAETDKQLQVVQQDTQKASDESNKYKEIKQSQNILEETKGKTTEEKKEIIIANNNEIHRTYDKTFDSDKNKELDKIRSEVEDSNQVTVKKEKNTKDIEVQAANKRLELLKVHDELKCAYTQVDSTKGKQLILLMISTVSKLESNPYYNSSSDQASAKAIYIKLNADIQNDIKIALQCNIDGESVPKLKKTFGF